MRRCISSVWASSKFCLCCAASADGSQETAMHSNRFCTSSSKLLSCCLSMRSSSSHADFPAFAFCLLLCVRTKALRNRACRSKNNVCLFQKLCRFRKYFGCQQPITFSDRSAQALSVPGSSSIFPLTSVEACAATWESCTGQNIGDHCDLRLWILENRILRMFLPSSK